MVVAVVVIIFAYITYILFVWYHMLPICYLYAAYLTICYVSSHLLPLRYLIPCIPAILRMYYLNATYTVLIFNVNNIHKLLAYQLYIVYIVPVDYL